MSGLYENRSAFFKRGLHVFRNTATVQMGEGRHEREDAHEHPTFCLRATEGKRLMFGLAHPWVGDGYLRMADRQVDQPGQDHIPIVKYIPS